MSRVERLGTAHAALAARDAVAPVPDQVFVLFGDTPLVRPETIERIGAKLSDGADLVVLGFRAANPFGYGRLLEEGGNLVAIREEKDASEAERQVTFCNSGIMGFSGARFLEILDAIGNDNANSEFYLTDAVEVARGASGCRWPRRPRMRQRCRVSTRAPSLPASRRTSRAACGRRPWTAA